MGSTTYFHPKNSSHQHRTNTGHKTGIEGVAPTKLAHIISVGANMTDFRPSECSGEMAFAGLNEAGYVLSNSKLELSFWLARARCFG